MAYVSGIAMWASVQEPNTTFDPAWKIDVVITDEEVVKTLKAQGLNIKPAQKGAEEFGKYVLNLKQPCTSKKTGEPNTPPEVVGPDAKPFIDLIGNGSEVLVEYNVGNWKFAGKSGVSAYLKGVQVLKHVPYGKETGFKPVNTDETEF